MYYQLRDTYEKIYCRLCNRFMKQISTGHCAYHQISVATYKLLYPKAPLVSQAWKDKKSKKMKEWCSNPNNRELQKQRSKKAWEKQESRKKYLAAFKLRLPQTEEVKERISLTMKKIYAKTDFPLKNLNSTQSEAYKLGTRINPWKLNKKELTPAEQCAKDILTDYGFEHNLQISTNRSHSGYFYLDFANIKLKVAIEISCTNLHGKEWRAECDRRKALALEELGWNLYIIWYNSSRRSSLRNTITQQLNKLIQKLNLTKETI